MTDPDWEEGMDGCFDGCADGCLDLDGCFNFGGGSSGKSSGYSPSYQAGRTAGIVADTALDAVDPDEPERSPKKEKEHRCRGKSKPRRVILWLTVQKAYVDEVVDTLVQYGRGELRLPKITLWMSLWAGLGWRRCAVVAYCHFNEEEVQLRNKLADLKRDFGDRIES